MLYKININDVDLDNALIDNKIYENILNYNSTSDTSCKVKPLAIIFDKEMDILTNMLAQNIQHYFFLMENP